MARVPYISKDDLPEEAHHIYDRIAQTRGAVESDKPMPHSFRALLNSPKAAEAVGQLGEYLRFNSSLDATVRETAILSVAKALDSDYEWAHHVDIARQVGVRDEVIEAIRIGRAPMGLPAKEGIFTQGAKELVEKGTLSPRTFQAIDHLLGPAQTVEFVVLVGYYAMLGTALRALDVELEPGLTSNLHDPA